MTSSGSVKHGIRRSVRSWSVPLMAALLITPLVSGCMENRAQQGAGIGALGGGLAGSLLGPSKNKEQNALIGAAIGGVLGYTVGNEMDKNDQARLNNAFETVPSRQTTTWVNPDTRAEYAVTPQPVYQSEGRECRQAEIASVINGRRETVMKTACRRPDGRWEM
ncbi:MAG: glycine zipper 2TM domain-containing protein [Magnetococcales bacterium]|nr:glycine zipper 2TM domain-containing protein [Magnetococcales bacterium]